MKIKENAWFFNFLLFKVSLSEGSHSCVFEGAQHNIVFTVQL